MKHADLIARGCIAVASLLLLAGCAAQDGEEGGPLSSMKSSSEKSLSQLQAEVSTEIDHVATIAGDDIHWYWLLDESLSWPTDQAKIFEYSGLDACSFARDAGNPSLVSVSLMAGPLEESVLGVVDAVVEDWSANGSWTITQVGPNYFRADGEDGAVMSIEGNDGVRGWFLSLAVDSTCSSDSSVTGR